MWPTLFLLGQQVDSYSVVQVLKGHLFLNSLLGGPGGPGGFACGPGGFTC